MRKEISKKYPADRTVQVVQPNERLRAQLILRGLLKPVVEPELILEPEEPERWDGMS